MTWCMQCGVSNKPVPAIGLDVEGEPACAMHRDRQVQPPKFDASFLEKRMKQFREKPETFDKVEPAAPSPLQATEQEKADMRTCSGFEGEICTEVLKEKNTSGMCTRHYARMMYRETHPKKDKRPTLREVVRVGTKTPATLDLQIAKVLEESDPFMVIRLRQSQVSKLLAQLL